MSSFQPPSSRVTVIGWLVPAVIFVGLVSIAVLVWHRQVQYQRSLLVRHTEDVCLQASRRLEFFVGFRLTAARIFAQRWSTHEQRDFSRQRFEEFARVLIRELPGYHTIRLVPADLRPGWAVNATGRVEGATLGPELRRLLVESGKQGAPLLSAPQRSGAEHNLFAAIPLRREKDLLGYFLVEFLPAAMIDACFHNQIRSEFSFTVGDGETVIYRFPEGPGRGESRQGEVSAERVFSIYNRAWWLTMAPRRAAGAVTGWRTSSSILVLGLAAAICLAWLVHLLVRRMELFRAARDQALAEIAERERAQAALRSSEARYRSVFDSATDGILILDEAGRVVEANQAARAMHGLEAGELVGQEVAALALPGQRQHYQQILRIGGIPRTMRFDTVHRRRDGGTLDVEVRGTSFRHGDRLRVLAILTDVSERKHAEQRRALLSQQVLRAQEEERARIARELHDELGQLLTALRFELDWLRRKSAPETQETDTAYASALELVAKAAEELRRICKGLRPPMLDDLGLDPAVRLLVDEFQERLGIEVLLDLQLHEGQASLPGEVALCTYRIIQESLNNVSRHARASQVTITLAQKEDAISLAVVDNGQGFDPSDPGTGRGSGLGGMRERASLVDGTVRVTSKPGIGTRVEFHVPWSSSEKEET